MSTFDSCKVICPYYLTDTSKHICCEGILENTTTHIQFKSYSQQREHLKNICSTHKYEQCKIARMLTQKYSDGKEN